jgi:hypothetical protein
MFVLLAAADASAQEPGGHRQVRIRLHDEDVVRGFLRGRSADEVVVYTGERRFRRVPLADIRAFEVRQRTGSHWKRGAFIGAIVWISVMKIAAIDSLEDKGLASGTSAGILAGSVGLGAGIGAAVPRYGWREADPRATSGRAGSPGLQVTLRF